MYFFFTDAEAVDSCTYILPFIKVFILLGFFFILTHIKGNKENMYILCYNTVSVLGFIKEIINGGTVS